MILALEILVVGAVIAALGAWIVGAMAYARALSLGGRGNRLKALVAWPFAAGGLDGEASAEARRVNKAIVAFFAAVLVAASAAALLSNFSRMLR